MTSGKGSIESIAVVPDSLVEIGKADLPFTALKDSPRETPVPPNPQATSRQSVLPFTTLTYPRSVAADKDVNVYVAERGRVLMMAAGSNDESELPITLKGVNDVAVHGAGNVYVSDFAGNRVLRLTTGSNEATALPFTGLDHPQGRRSRRRRQCVPDRQQRLRSDRQDGRKLMRRLIAALFVLAVGVTGCSHATTPTAPTSTPPPAPVQSVLGFTDLNGPYDVAVDTEGNVFVSDIDGGQNGSNRVLELPAGSTTQMVLPFARATVMADPAGEVWVLDGRRQPSTLVKLAHGAGEQTVVPLPNLGKWSAIQAVDNAGDVYGMTGGGVDSGGGCCQLVPQRRHRHRRRHQGRTVCG